MTNIKEKNNNKSEPKLPTKEFWLSLWRLMEPIHKSVSVIFVLTISVEIMNLAGPYLVKLIVDELTNFSLAEIKAIAGLIVLIFISDQANMLLDLFRERRIFRSYFELEAHLHLRAHRKFMFQSLSYHERENTGTKITKIERGVQKILDLLGNMFWEVVPTLLQLVVTIVVLFVVHWWFALSFLFFAPLFIVITLFANKKLYPRRKQRFEDYDEASGKLGESIVNINTVKSFVQERREYNEYRGIFQNIVSSGIKEWYTIINFSSLRTVIVDLGRIIMIILATYSVWHGSISIGTLVFVFTLSEKSYLSLWRLSRFYDRVEEGNIAVRRYMKVINASEDIANPPHGFKPKTITGEVAFEKVVFAYDSSRQKALKGIDLRIASGCVTALVGPSGGGKTTVAKMIYRHYDPQAGRVIIDGRDVKEYDIYGFRKFIAIVPQEVEIFNTSVRDNISYANHQAGSQEVEAAARIANAEEFILKLPQKYDTEVGERGIKLSGGQRQRVGIARAILANPRILIFDEATSNLDSMSERLIQEAMEKIRKGRTVIIIAHRLSTIKKANKIIVLENGQVVEEGSHYELAQEKGGLYARLLALQKMGDVE